MVLGQLDQKLAESNEKQKESSLQLAQAEEMLKSTREELEQLKAQSTESSQLQSQVDQKLAESMEQQKHAQNQLEKAQEELTAARKEIEQVKKQSTESENQLKVRDRHFPTEIFVCSILEN